MDALITTLPRADTLCPLITSPVHLHSTMLGRQTPDPRANLFSKRRQVSEAMVNAEDRREQQLRRVDAALLRVAESSVRGRELALDDLKWQTRVELSHASLPVLSRLNEQPMRLTELAAALRVSGPAVSRQVQLLQEKGLVERMHDESDGRATIVRLSPKGVEAVTKAANTRRALLRQVLADWTDEYIEQASPVLERLAGELAKWDHR
mgnify:CR=1 FL=1